MGEVDKNDQLRGYYLVRTKSQKNYKYIFWFLFDAAIVNSFILYGLSPATGRKTMKEFQVELAQLIGSYNSCRYGGRPQANKQYQLTQANEGTPLSFQEQPRETQGML